MKTGLKIGISFVLGSAVGSTAAYIFTKSKLEKAYTRDVEAIRELYKKEPDVEIDVVSKQDIDTTENIVEDNKYATKSSLVNDTTLGKDKTEDEKNKSINKYWSPVDENNTGTERKNVIDIDEFEVEYISDEEFGDIDGFRAVALDYYRDGILVDEDGDLWDVNEHLGSKAMDHFGDYQPGILYVLNKTYEAYYEVNYINEDYETAKGEKIDW